MSPIAANLQAVRRRISEALQGDSREVTLVAVSKSQSPDAVLAAFDAGCPKPGIEGILHPIRYGNGSYVPSFADQIHDGPALLATLQALQGQFCKLAAAQPATEQSGQNRSIAFSSKSLVIG